MWGKELGSFSSVRRSFSKLLSRIPVRILAAATVIVGLSLTLVAYGVISRSITIGSGGTVNLPVGVGFYWDNDCTDPVSFVDWGAIQPGSTVDVTVFVRNEGSQAFSLNITAENWDPIETTSYMIFSSDCTGQIVGLQETIQITLSLTTSSSIERITSFRFDITVVPNLV